MDELEPHVPGSDCQEPESGRKLAAGRRQIGGRGIATRPGRRWAVLLDQSVHPDAGGLLPLHAYDEVACKRVIDALVPKLRPGMPLSAKRCFARVATQNPRDSRFCCTAT